MKKLLVFIWLCVISLVSSAEEHYSSILQEANELYKKEQYEDAISAYNKVLSANYESAALYYNIGNAYYKTGGIPQAILFYEKSLKLNPGNSDCQHNLKLANQQITDSIDTIPTIFYKQWWTGIRGMFSPNLWGWIAILSLFAAAVKFAFFKTANNPQMKKLAFYAGLSLVFIALLSTTFGLQLRNQIENSHEAIVFTPSLTVKSSPSNNSTDLFVIHEGTKVTVMEEIDDWIKISISDGNTGWIKSDDIEKI